MIDARQNHISSCVSFEDFKIFLVTEGTEIYRTSRVIDIIRLGPPIYSWKQEDTRVSLNLFHEDRERIS